MIRLLDDLPDLESRLLMYAAGELSPEDADAVRRELAEHPEGAARLEAIRRLLEGTETNLSAADAIEPIGERVLERARHRAVREVRDWVEGRQVPAEHADLRQGVVWRYARYPLAAAAVLVVGLLLWHHASEPLPRLGGLTEIPREDPDSGLALARLERDAQADANLERAAALFEHPGDGGDLTLVQLDLRGELSEDLEMLRLLDPDNWD